MYVMEHDAFASSTHYCSVWKGEFITDFFLECYREHILNEKQISTDISVTEFHRKQVFTETGKKILVL